jgi:hypothetical protein
MKAPKHLFLITSRTAKSDPSPSDVRVSRKEAEACAIQRTFNRYLGRKDWEVVPYDKDSSPRKAPKAPPPTGDGEGSP